MRFNRLLSQNIKKSQKDYAIYSISFIFLCALLFSANAISFLDYQVDETGIMISNSLPLIISITSVCFGIYINKFMIRQRSKEFATYMLSGLNKSNIILLYGIETFIIGVVSLIIGAFVGFIFTQFMGVLTKNSLLIINDIAIIWKIFVSTLIQTIILHLVIILYSSYIIWNSTLKSLIYKRQHNEKPYNNNKYKWESKLLVLLFLIFTLQLCNIDSFVSSSTIFIVLCLIIYTGYLFIIKYFQLSRQNNNLYYHKEGRLFLMGQVLSKQRSLVILSSVLSLCFLISFISYILGAVFINSYEIILDEHLDEIMGIAQLYFAVLFLVVIIGIIGLKQAMEIRENQKNIIILRNLGTSKLNLNRIILRQIIINYMLPLVLAIAVSVYCLVLIYQQEVLLFWMKERIIGATVQFGTIFLIVLSCFIFTTYSSYRNQINSALGR